MNESNVDLSIRSISPEELASLSGIWRSILTPESKFFTIVRKGESSNGHPAFLFRLYLGIEERTGAYSAEENIALLNDSISVVLATLYNIGLGAAHLTLVTTNRPLNPLWRARTREAYTE